jgi:hypothetical protein
MASIDVFYRTLTNGLFVAKKNGLLSTALHGFRTAGSTRSRRTYGRMWKAARHQSAPSRTCWKRGNAFQVACFLLVCHDHETWTTTNHPTGPRGDRELAAPSAPRRDTCRAAMRRSPRGGLDAFRSVAAVDPAFCATRRRSSDPRLDPGESRICGERSGQKGVSSAVASLVRICRFPVGGGAGFVQVTGTLKICCSLSCF